MSDAGTRTLGSKIKFLVVVRDEEEQKFDIIKTIPEKNLYYSVYLEGLFGEDAVNELVDILNREADRKWREENSL